VPGSDADIASLRREYVRAGLDEGDLAESWHAQFRHWLDDAVAAGLPDANAVVLATASAQGVPSARTVLLKGLDGRGFVLYTNLASRKASEAAANPHASLVFPWLGLERQVVVCGAVEQVSREQTAAYFRTRPHGAQLGAWASRQSSVVPSRSALEQRRREVEERFAGGEVPVPPFWGGLRVVPDSVEFWQGRPERLHDRLRYRHDGEAWVVERLSP
jgi:pyridoxamine 5'-phosphate oxidase